jgi:hypothetical protein
MKYLLHHEKQSDMSQKWTDNLKAFLPRLFTMSQDAETPFASATAILV